jgi:hypothetical protein
VIGYPLGVVGGKVKVLVYSEQIPAVVPLMGQHNIPSERPTLTISGVDWNLIPVLLCIILN